MAFYLRRLPIWAQEMADYGIAEMICAARGIARDRILSFLDPIRVQEKVSPVQEFPVLVQAARLLVEWICAKKKILVWGDYDCDGIMASAIMDDLLFNRTERLIHIPERADGYGINLAVLTKLVDEYQPDCLLTVDNGITAAYEIAWARKKGISVIVTDHHMKVGDIPAANILVDPLLTPSGKYKFLCGAGIAWLLANITESLLQKKVGYVPKDKRLWSCYAGIATIADIVPLGVFDDLPVNANRFLVRRAMALLEEMALEPKGESFHNGLQSLLNVNNHKQVFVPSSYIAFTIGPAINACGRLTTPTLAFSMIKNKSASLAARCIRINGLRKERTGAAILELRKKLASERFVISGQFNVGLVGLLAGKLAEETKKPIVVVTMSAGQYTGSARAPEGYPLMDFLRKSSHCLIRYGGHARAAGCTIAIDQLEAFRTCFSDLVDAYPVPDPITYIDAEIGCQDITMSTYFDLARMEPFGNGNPKPLFLIRNVAITNIRKVGVSREHLLFTAFLNGHLFNGKFWNAGQYYEDLREKPERDIVAQLTEPYGSRMVPELEVIAILDVGTKISEEM